MKQYLKKGEVNPHLEPTQTGFRRLFAAWILDESLPWTTGEAPTLEALFKYLKVNFALPSDTSVRNELAKIFAELHGKIVKEFAVSVYIVTVCSIKLQVLTFTFKTVKSKIAYATDTWTTKQMVYTFACTVACFIDDDWELIERVVDFKPLEDKEHEGYFGGMAFVNGAKDMGGLKQMSRFKISDNRQMYTY